MENIGNVGNVGNVGLIICFLGIGVLWLWCKCTGNLTEHFGGPVKNSRKIPKTDCYGICGQYYRDCMKKFGNVDANFCHRRKESCISGCNYTDFQYI